MPDKRKQGELESEVMGCLWEHPQGLSSQQILSQLGPQLKLTTVLTVLSRLQEKGLVTKSASAGRSFIFSATQTRAQYTAELLLNIVGQDANPAGVFSHFTQGLTKHQIAELKRALGD